MRFFIVIIFFTRFLFSIVEWQASPCAVATNEYLEEINSGEDTLSDYCKDTSTVDAVIGKNYLCSSPYVYRGSGWYILEDGCASGSSYSKK